MNCEGHWQWIRPHINVRIRHLKYCVCVCVLSVSNRNSEMWYKWGLQCSSCPVNNLACFDVAVWSEVALSLHHLWHVNPASILSPYLLKGRQHLLWLPVYALSCSVSHEMSPVRQATLGKNVLLFAFASLFIRCYWLSLYDIQTFKDIQCNTKHGINMNMNTGNALFLKGL